MTEQYDDSLQELPESPEDKSRIGSLVDRVKSREFINQAVWSIGSILLALVVAAVIMIMGGYDPGTAFLYLAIGAITSFDQVLWYASPLILAGLSVALAFKCGLFNIGAEGQVYIGSMVAALVAYLWAFPIVIHPILCLAAGMLAGALWGFIPGLLKAYRGAHEVVTTMMISYATILFTSWLVGPNGPFWDGSMVSRTPQFYDTALLPLIFGDYLHFGFIIALMAVFGVDYLINRTVLGYEMRAVGNNIDAAEYAGIDSKKKVAIALAISGALSALAGSTEIIGSFDRFTAKWSSGIGWDGITVAVLGNNNPWGVLAGAIFFGALKAGGNTMHTIAHVPIEMVKVIQGLVVLFVAAPRIIQWLMEHTTETKENLEIEPKKAGPRLLIAIFGLASVFIGLGVGKTILLGGMLSAMISFAALIVIVTAVLGILVFIAAYSKDPRSSQLLLVIAIGWLIGTILWFFGAGVFDITSILMSGIAFAFWIAMRMLAKNSVEEGNYQ